MGGCSGRLSASLIGAPDIPFPPDLDKRVSGNLDFFFRHEYKAFTQYIPDVKRMRENKVKMVTAVGRDSDDSQYVQSTRALASKLRCARIPDNVETREVLENLLFNLSLKGIFTDDNIRQIIRNR